jgi:peptide deformylase
MAVIPINVYGDKILRKKTRLVSEKDIEKMIPFIKNMWDTLRTANGLGLAANQVGLDKSIFVVDVSPVEGYEKIKPVIMINPKILLSSDEKEKLEEGCLSLPSVRVEVSRSKNIKIAYQDTDLNEKILEPEDLFARVIQHEYDHLFGTLITDKLMNGMKKNIKDDLQKIKNRELEIDYLITEKE